MQGVADTFGKVDGVKNVEGLDCLFDIFGIIASRAEVDPWFKAVGNDAGGSMAHCVS